MILDRELLPLDLTFGVELECIGDKATEFIESNPTDFSVERDLSLDKEKGIEFISPIMNYNGFDLYTLRETLNFIKSNGFYVDSTCGGHVHIGASYLEKLGAVLNLLLLFKYYEKEIYAISNAPKDRIRGGAEKHAYSIFEIMSAMETALKENRFRGCSSIDQSKHIKDGPISDSKAFGLNIRNIGEENKNTVEFRCHNGTLDEKTLLENIVLDGSMGKTAKEIYDNYDYQLEVCNIFSQNRTSEKKVELLLDMLFGKQDELKKIYLERYEHNISDPMLGLLCIKDTLINRYPTIRRVAEKRNGR